MNIDAMTDEQLQSKLKWWEKLLSIFLSKNTLVIQSLLL